jgi:hypothetical protein
MPRPCRSHAMPCRYGFSMCPYHLIYTVRPCLIHTCHAALLKATAQHGRRDCLWATCRRWASTGYRAEFQEGYQKHTKLRCRWPVRTTTPFFDYNNSVTLTLNHIALVRGCFASVRYLLLTSSILNISPYTPSPTYRQRFPNLR